MAPADEIPIGVVGLEPAASVALLRSLVVASGHRHEGLGHRLTETIEQYVRQRDLHTLYLLTTTAADYFSWRGYHRTLPPALQPPRKSSDSARRTQPAGESPSTRALKRLRESAPPPHFVAVPMMCGDTGGTPILKRSISTDAKPACWSSAPVSRSGWQPSATAFQRGRIPC